MCMQVQKEPGYATRGVPYVSCSRISQSRIFRSRIFSVPARPIISLTVTVLPLPPTSVCFILVRQVSSVVTVYFSNVKFPCRNWNAHSFRFAVRQKNRFFSPAGVSAGAAGWWRITRLCLALNSLRHAVPVSRTGVPDGKSASGALA